MKEYEIKIEKYIKEKNKNIIRFFIFTIIAICNGIILSWYCYLGEKGMFKEIPELFSALIFTILLILTVGTFFIGVSEGFDAINEDLK